MTWNIIIKKEEKRINYNNKYLYQKNKKYEKYEKKKDNDNNNNKDNNKIMKWK